MQCTKCQTVNKADRRFCSTCGAELAFCPRCGRPYDEGDRYCGQCGELLDQILRRQLTAIGPRAYTPQHLAAKILNLRSVLEGERKQVTVLFCDLANSTELSERLGPEDMFALLNRFFELALMEIHRYEGTVNQFLGDGFMALFGAPIAHEDHARRAALAAHSIRGVLGEAEPDLTLRMGLNTGPVVVGKIGDNLRMDYTAVGDTTNVAARLQQAADPDTILVGEATATSLRGFLRLEPLPALLLKGKSEPVTAWRVMGKASLEMFEERSSGAGRPPFLGRDAELEFLGQRMERVLEGQGQAVAMSGDPGVGKSRLLRELRRSTDRESTRYLEGRCLSYGAGTPYLPIAEILRFNAGIVDDDSPMEVAAKLRRSFDEVGLDESSIPYVLQVLGVKEGTEAIAAITPEAVKARTSALLIELAVLSSRRRPLLMVVEDIHWIDKTSEDLLASLVAALPGTRILLVTTFRTGYRPPWADNVGVSDLSLRALSPQASLAVADALLGDRHPAGLAGAIATRADGNPFFLEELVHTIVERSVAQAALLPNRVQDVIMARLDRLPEDAKRLVQTAAVLGREVPIGLLELVWEDTGGTSHIVSELVRLEFMQPGQTAQESVVVFRHALTQEVAYDSLLGPRRRYLHARTGAALEAVYAGRTEERCELLAHHYRLGGDHRKALDYLALASKKAARANAVVESRGHYLQAISILDGLPDTPIHRKERATLLLDQAIVFFLMLDFGTYHRMLRDHEALFLSLGDEALLGSYYTRLGHFEYVPGQFRKSLELARKGAVLCERTGDWDNAAYAHMLAQWDLLFLGRYDDAIAGEEAARRALEKSFNLRWYVWSLSASAFAHMWQGRWVAAIEKGRDIVGAAERLSDDSMLSFSAVVLAIVFRYQGDLDQALAMAELAARKAPTPTDRLLTQSGLAWVKCHRGDGTAQLPALKQLVGIMQALDFRANFYTLLFGEALLASGAQDEAYDVLEGLIESARRVEMRLELGPALRLMGELLLETNPEQLEEPFAEPFLEESATVLSEMGASDALARTWVALGRLLERRGRPDEARQYFTDALGVFERLGSLGEPALIRELLDALPSSPSRGRRSIG